MAFRYSGAGWRVARSLETFGNQIMDLRGSTASLPTDGTVGDTAHSARVSDHNPDEQGIVRALDFHEWATAAVDEVFEAVRTSQDPRLKYAIHAGRMFSSYSTPSRQPWEWGPYSGPNPHSTHGHLSVVADSRADQNHPWIIQLGQEEEEMALTPSEENTAKALHAELAAAGYGTLASRTAAISQLISLLNAPAGTAITEAQVRALVADEMLKRISNG